MPLEFSLKTKATTRPQKVPKPDNKPKTQSVPRNKTGIVFKREDFMEMDKLARDIVEKMMQHQKSWKQGENGEILMTSESIQMLKLHQHLNYKLVAQLGLTNLTQIQQLAIPVVRSGADVFIKSSTGTGKTLAFLIPILDEILRQQEKLTRQDLRLLVISPTRELSSQTEDLIQSIINSTKLVLGAITGGCARDSEKQQIRKGVNIMTATPGRLQDHLEKTENLLRRLKGLQWLVLDECDHLTQSANVSSIISRVCAAAPKNIQKIFVSATISDQVVKLSRQYLRQPEMVQTADQLLSKFKLPDTLVQSFTVVNQKMRLAVLIALVAQYRGKRVLLFSESKAGCDFLHEVLVRVNRGFGCLDESIQVLHGGISAEFRNKTFESFKENGGVIITTDVAARGLNLGNRDRAVGGRNYVLADNEQLSGVDIVVQYEAFNSVEQYVHKAGRAGRLGQQGRSVLFLNGNEVSVLCQLVEETHQLVEYQPADQIGEGVPGADIQVRFFERLQQFVEQQVEQDPDLKEIAISAYQTYVSGYCTKDRAIRPYFKMSDLHLGHIAKAYGLLDPPSRLADSSRHGREQARRQKEWERASEKTKSLIRAHTSRQK